MIEPDLRSSAFQVLSALAVTENRSTRGNMTPLAKAFDNQRPQAIAATDPETWMNWPEGSSMLTA